MVPVFKHGVEKSAKDYSPVSLVNNRIVDHIEKCALLSDFQYGFRSSQSTADLELIELLGLLTDLGLLELQHLI